MSKPGADSAVVTRSESFAFMLRGGKLHILYYMYATKNVHRHYEAVVWMSVSSRDHVCETRRMIDQK